MKAAYSLVLLPSFLGLIDATPVRLDNVRRDVPADDISKYTVDFFLDKRRFELPPDSCFFYNKEAGEAAKKFTEDKGNDAITIWDVWSCDLYNDNSKDQENPLRDIMADENVRRNYFARMSEAYAFLCSGAAVLYTKDVDNIPEDGIWGQVEFPTLKRTNDFDPPKGRVEGVTAVTVDEGKSKLIYQRSSSPQSKVISFANNTTLRARSPPEGFPSCVSADEVDTRYGYLDF